MSVSGAGAPPSPLPAAISQTGSLLSIDEHRVGRRAVLAAAGEVDISSAADLRRALEGVRGDGVAEIWLDFTRTTFMDSNGLHALLDLHDSLRDANRRDANQRLVVICPAGPVLRLLVLAGVDCELEIHPTCTAAQYGGYEA